MLFLTVTVAFALALVTGTKAQTVSCFNNNPSGTCGSSYATHDEAYAARQDFCGTTTWQTDACITADQTTVTISSAGAGTGQACFDAYDDLIKGCHDNGFVGGDIEIGGVFYGMNWCAGGC